MQRRSYGMSVPHTHIRRGVSCTLCPAVPLLPVVTTPVLLPPPQCCGPGQSTYERRRRSAWNGHLNSRGNLKVTLHNWHSLVPRSITASCATVSICALVVRVHLLNCGRISILKNFQMAEHPDGARGQLWTEMLSLQRRVVALNTHLVSIQNQLDNLNSIISGLSADEQEFLDDYTKMAAGKFIERQEQEALLLDHRQRLEDCQLKWTALQHDEDDSLARTTLESKLHPLDLRKGKTNPGHQPTPVTSPQYKLFRFMAAKIFEILVPENLCKFECPKSYNAHGLNLDNLIGQLDQPLPSVCLHPPPSTHWSHSSFSSSKTDHCTNSMNKALPVIRNGTKKGCWWLLAATL
jgi:hypothetical protein